MGDLQVSFNIALRFGASVYTTFVPPFYRMNNRTNTMKKSLLFALLLGSLSGLHAQYVTLSGYVRDTTNGEDLIGVSVYTTEPRYGTVTNSYGFYSLTLPAGTYEINISYLGYKTTRRMLKIDKNRTLNVNLAEESQQLQEVVVTGNSVQERLAKPQMSVAKLSAKEIQKIPQFLGEVDVVRTLTLLPGVSTVGEGANGFNVRGGNVDQNLILIDDAPVFNSSHLFGFFSIFNGDAVKDVQLYKGGMPAQYGGRLSSVLDVRQKDGNSKRFGGTGGLGLLSSRLMLEGPIVKDKVSFMVAGRRSYQDLFFGLSNDPEISNTKLFFYDLNGKLSWEINSRNKIYFSAYYGRDLFGANDLFDFGWGNGTATIRWNSLFSPKLFMNITAVYSDYTYELGTPDTDITPFKWTSRIRNYMGKAAFTWYPNNKNTIDYGLEVNYYNFEPGRISGIITSTLQNEYALEPALYINDEWKLSPRITVAAGLRYGWFYNLGARTIQYYSGSPISDENVVDERTFGSGEVIAQYGGIEGLEPRLSINYRLTEMTSFKLSYNRNRQFIQLISNGTTPTPIDIWRPAGTYIEPAVVNQIAVGYFQSFVQDKYLLTAEAYYKDYQNLIDYKNGAQLIFTDHIETELLNGRGRAYGLELMFEKKQGKLTGWVSYTLSRTERQVDRGADPAEWINDGEWYLSNYDKTHDLSLVLTYTINKRWDVSMNFAYQTGRPMTPPESRATFENVAYPVTINRNNQRIPDYHRLDVAANYYFKKKKPERRWQHSLNIGVYNVYARKNAYSIFFRQNTDTGQTEAVRLSIFATAIPSITYNFSF
jgi:hypothetical protein